ncbi:MAG TPA: hypothetical protein PLU73_04440 [Bacteroidia bacterium]|nr:hypothetical protein [Bacteroidia bacterium]
MVGRRIIQLICCLPGFLIAQMNFSEPMKKTLIAGLNNGDSLTYYQCHVEIVQQDLQTAGGQTLSVAPEKCSITEKFIVFNNNGNYRIKYFVSSVIALPNRRFSGLKIKEKKYWNFKSLKDTLITEKGVKLLAAIELKGKEPTEYEFAVTKYITNQVIIKRGKKFKQLVIEGDHLLSKLIFEN